MRVSRLTLADCLSTEWDAIVVGTGMGGATIGFELARFGRSVLFIEKGPFLHASLSAAPHDVGLHLVDTSEGRNESELVEAKLKHNGSGSSPGSATVRASLGSLNFSLPVGFGSGGSTSIYAGALERFAPIDFEPRKNFPNAYDSSLPARWPITYEELAPFYEYAETLFHVSGTRDPLYTTDVSHLRTPPELNARDHQLATSLVESGLHPYRIHAGFDFVPNCDGCPGGPCPHACKKDAAWTCLVPALCEHDAALLSECEVVRTRMDGVNAQAVVCCYNGTEFEIAGRTIILAAGAFSTPMILLRSISPAWPHGVGNQYDLVGRNLMFHGGDFLAISPATRHSNGDGPQKTLALNDFYVSGDLKLGTFQTLGANLELGRIIQYLRDTAESSTTWWARLLGPHPVWWRRATSPFVRLGALALFYLFRFKAAAIWVTIVEDLPYLKNRVRPHPESEDQVLIEYEYSNELRDRVLAMRTKIKRALAKKHRVMVLSSSNKIDYPHVCGTCRFGDSPEASVLDRNNRVHGTANLYVVDSSFFPSSAGTNPSLTIAANAVRVAQIIIDTQGAPGEPNKGGS